MLLTLCKIFSCEISLLLERFIYLTVHALEAFTNTHYYAQPIDIYISVSKYYFNCIRYY